MNDFTFVQGVRSDKYECYYFQAHDGGFMCIESRHDVNTMKVLKDGSWVPYFSGIDIDNSSFNEFLERGRACL